MKNMKTSNKVLWSMISAIFLIVLALAIIMRTHSPSGFTFAFYHNQIAGNGKIITTTRNLPKFDSIRMDVVGKVVVKPGDHFQIAIKNDKNLIAHINTKVESGILVVKSKNNASLDPSDQALYTITTNDLKSFKSEGVNQVIINHINPAQFKLTLSGSGNAELSGETKNLQMNISGRGNIIANKLITTNTNIDLSGSGHLTLTGKTKNLRIHISGRGKINAKNFISDNADIHISGIGDIVLHVQNSLDCYISGAGKIKYYGHPTKINKHISGSGRVDPITENQF